MNYQYSYLIGNLFLLLIWTGLFLYKKDNRKEMIFISFIFGFIGIFVEIFYIHDWWNPLFIIGRLPGLESFLTGFNGAGISAVIYTTILNRKTKQKSKNINNIKFSLIIVLALSLLSFSYLILKLNSFYSSVIALIIPTIIVLIQRKDLIKPSILTGIFFLSISFLFFLFMHFVSPGWIQHTWYFKNFSKKIILFAPLDDLIWGFLSSLFIAPLYKYWTNTKIV